MRRKWKGVESDSALDINWKQEAIRAKANLTKLQSHYDRQQLRLKELESGLITKREADLLAEIKRLKAIMTKEDK